MCDPVTMAIGSFAVSAASTVVGYMGEQQAYREHETFRAENAARARENGIQQYNANLTRIGQEGDAAGAEKGAIIREARAARARASVAAGESGVSGISVDSLIADFYGQEGSYKDRLDEQVEWTTRQLQYEQKGIRANAEDRANSIPKGTRPNLFAAGLRIGGAGLDSYNSYNRWTGAYS